MKVFVTGIAGFLGSHVAEACHSRGYEVTGIDNMLGGDAKNIPSGVTARVVDCNHPNDYADLLQGVDVVYHCAAAPYEGLSVNSPRVVWEHTTMTAVSVTSAAISAGATRVVLCSSMARYGDQVAPFHETMDPRPVDPYGHAKVAAENAVRNLCEIHDVEWSIAVPHNIYGPRQRFVDPYRNVVGIMINRILLGKQPIIYGDGSQRRCFSYIGDVVEPLLALGERRGVVGEVVNVGPDDESVTINELAALLLEELDSSLEPLYFPGRPHEVHAATCSADKARKLLDYESTWSLRDGLCEQIAWVRALGPRPFVYHLPIEIETPSTPRTWVERLI
jgi:UDP-glucose 4-epimerase